MTRTQAITQIEKEFAAARYARENGNEGMARVCARRAAGIAIGCWLEDNPREGWGTDALGRLRSVRLDESMPKDVRDAAMRLTTKVTQQFESQFTTDPIEDSKAIVNHLLHEM